MTPAHRTDAIVGPNAEIADMVKAGVREAIILGFIKRHDGAFDVSAGAQAALRKAGASEQIITAMIEQATLADSAPPTPPPPPTSSSTPVAAATANAAEFQLSDGAVVRLQLVEPLVSNVAKLNDLVRLQAAADVMVDGRIVIARGALA